MGILYHEKVISFFKNIKW